MKAKAVLTLLTIVILVFFGATVYFVANTPNIDMIRYIQSKSPEKDAQELIPTSTPTPTPTPKFAKLGARTYTTFPGVLPEADRLHKKAVITTAKGDIELELFGDEAPKAVSNFIFLAKDKFFDGLTFHRVIQGFVAQGGDPAGNGTGGPGYSFQDEPVKRPYTKGIVAMANSGPNTNGSQFFIMLADNSSLAPIYTIFGQVVKGQEVVDKIAIGDVMNKVTIANYVAVSPSPAGGP